MGLIFGFTSLVQILSRSQVQEEKLLTNCFRSAFIEVRKRPKMPHPTVLFALNLMQCQRRLQISRVKNIGSLFELSGVGFRLVVPSYGGLLILNSDNFRLGVASDVTSGVPVDYADMAVRVKCFDSRSNMA